ncbi:MAG: DUF6033 family protein [Roseburia sp.]|nr:DUF6033 family protein [Roseburia sp.]
MAVKVGDSWVSEAAYAYAQRQAESGGKGSEMARLSEQFPDLKFSTGTKPFSGEGLNNIGIAPNILREMESNPEKRLEYEALIYDCNEVIRNMPTKTANGSTIKSFGFIIGADGGLSAWSVSESGGADKREKFALDKSRKDSWLEQMRIKKKEKDKDSYEKSDEDKETTGTYSVNTMSSDGRAALVERLKKEQEAREQQLADLVRQMLSKQANAYGNATNMWQFLASGSYTVDAATKAQAQKDISEDGYYGVKQTSQRLFDFASALAGDDVEKMREMQAAMQKGFDKAQKSWGGQLPGICQQTINAANKMFDEYYASKKAL